MKTLKRYCKLYRVFVSQFFKSILQSKANFMIGLVGFFLTQITGILFLYLVFEQIPDLQGWSLTQLVFIYGFAQIPRGIDHLFTDNLWLVAWRLVVTGEASMEMTMERLNEIDLQTLNRAIENLADVIEPLAKFFNIFN